MESSISVPKQKADSASKPPRRRRRRACDSCFKKKIQCDAESPQCNWCKHHNLACTYNRLLGQPEKKKRTSLYLAERPQNYHTGPGSTRTGDNTGLRTAITDRYNMISARDNLSNVAYFNGIYLLSAEGRKWIESRTGETVHFEKLCALELPWQNSHHPMTDLVYNANVAIRMPSRNILETYVGLYTSSLQNLVFPVISKSLFKNTLDLAYDSCQSTGSASAKSCVYAFLAIVSLFGFDTNVQGVMDCGTYASTARSFTDQIIQEMTVDGLQSVTMLLQFQYFLGDLQAAAVSLSIATRLLYALGAHTLPTDDPLLPSQPYDKRNPECHLRDLFWLCYSFDKDISLRTGQPPCINDSHCDLTLPANYAQLQDFNILRDETLVADNTLPLFPFDLHLSLIKSEAYQTLYSFSARKKPNTELLSKIMELDEALEKWRISLHPDFRPTLSFSRQMPVNIKVNTQAVILRLAYYHCVTIIHQASTRCTPSPGDNERQLDGISSSISLSINASRSTLSYLQTVLPVVKGECFWVVLFYAITAILTLFSSILRAPRDAEVFGHLDVLCEVPDLIRKIPIRKLTLGEVMHLRFLDGFTTELARLGQSAICKALREADGLSTDVHVERG